MIITNHHVVAESKYLRVKINDTVKVKAKLLGSDPIKDIAAIWVNPNVIKDIKPLPLAKSEEGKPSVYIGKKVVAIGSPISQTNILTSGIVSKVDGKAIMSDVNINYGNSGGPMLNMLGEVVGINTFVISSKTGPGFSGSVLISEIMPLMKRIRSKINEDKASEDTLLPIMPEELFPLDALKSAVLVDKFNEKPYHFKSGNFTISVSAPPYDYYRMKRAELRLKSKRASREIKAGKKDQSRTELFSDLTDRLRQADLFQPVVKFER